MKKFTLFIFGLMASFALFSQTQYPIPNWNFETLTPASWGGVNSVYQTKLNLTVNGHPATLNPVSGKYFLQITNTSSSVGYATEKFPFTGRPDSFSFQGGYFVGNASEMWGCVVTLSVWNTTTNSRDTVMTMFIHPNQPGQLTPWTAVNVPISSSLYKSASNPDSCAILFINDIAVNTSGQLIATTSTTFLIDNVVFGYQAPTGQTWTTINNDIVTINSIYYNNNNLYLTYSSKDILNNGNIAVYDITGRSVYNKDLKIDNIGDNNTILPLNNLKSGVYILSLTTENGRITKKFVVE